MIELLSDERVIVTLFTALLALALYFVRQHVNLVKTLDKEAVRSKDLEVKHKENNELMRTINDTVTATLARLQTFGVLEHRLQIAEKNIQDLRDFKHASCEPAVRYLDFLKTEKPWEEVAIRSEDHLSRIENKIDAYEERASNTRHDIRNTVQALAGEVQSIKSERRPR